MNLYANDLQVSNHFLPTQHIYFSSLVSHSVGLYQMLGMDIWEDPILLLASLPFPPSISGHLPCSSQNPLCSHSACHLRSKTLQVEFPLCRVSLLLPLAHSGRLDFKNIYQVIPPDLAVGEKSNHFGMSLGSKVVTHLQPIQVTSRFSLQ